MRTLATESAFIVGLIWSSKKMIVFLYERRAQPLADSQSIQIIFLIRISDHENEVKSVALEILKT